MKNEDTIGPGFLEKLLIILSPLIIGIIGYFLPKTLFLINKIPIVSDMKIIKLIESFNPFWTSITLAIIGLIIGIFFSLIILYSLSMSMDRRVKWKLIKNRLEIFKMN